MNLQDLLSVLWARPKYQRLFLAFSVGLMLACAARVAAGPVDQAPVALQH